MVVFQFHKESISHINLLGQKCNMKSSGIRYAIASLLGFHECRSATSRRLPRRPSHTLQCRDVQLAKKAATKHFRLPKSPPSGSDTFSAPNGPIMGDLDIAPTRPS